MDYLDELMTQGDLAVMSLIPVTTDIKMVYKTKCLLPGLGGENTFFLVTGHPDEYGIEWIIEAMLLIYWDEFDVPIEEYIKQEAKPHAFDLYTWYMLERRSILLYPN